VEDKRFLTQRQLISFHAVSIDDKEFARRFLDRFEIYGVRFSNGFKLDTVL